MKSNASYYVLMHLIIFIWGFTGILGKLIHLEAMTLVWYRVLIASVSLYIGVVLLKKQYTIKQRKNNYLAIFVGLLVATHWVTFYISIQLSTASLGILCLSTATLHVTWLDPLILKRKFSWMEFVLGLIVIFGIFIVSQDFSKNDFIALAFGLVSALAAAAFNVFNAKLVQEETSSAITLVELVTSFVALSLVLFFQGKLNAHDLNMSLSDFLWLLFLGIACTSLAFLLTIDIIKKLGSFTVSLSINLEPVYTMILAIFILNEHHLLSLQFYLGSAVIILVVVANGFIKNWQKSRIRHIH